MLMLGLADQVSSKIHRSIYHRTVRLAHRVRASARYCFNAVTAAAPPAASGFLVRSQLAFASKPKARAGSGGKKLEIMVDRMKQEVQRLRRVRMATLCDAIEMAKCEQHASLENTTMVQILRFTGRFLRQLPPDVRMELTEVVWSLADHASLDISHYNVLLQVYLENGTLFDPLAFLETLNESSLTPNYITYQRLLQRYCDSADLGGAKMIYELMKNEELPESECVLNALVKGHVLAGDEISARKVIDYMARSEKTPPTNETYTDLARSFIEKGYTDKALEAIEGRSLSDGQILRIAEAFAMRNDTESMKRVLDKMPQHIGYTRDTINSCLDMISLKKLNVFRILFDKIPVDSNLQEQSNSLISQMVRSHVAVTDVMNFCYELKDKGVSQSGFVKAVETALKYSDRRTMFDYLKLMPLWGVPLRGHFFYPVVCKAQNECEVFDTIRSVVRLGLPVTEEMLVNYVLPKLNVDQPGQVIERTLQTGCSRSKCVYALVKYLLANRKVEKCLEVLAKHKCILNASVAVLAGEVANVENIAQCVKVLKEIVNQPTDRVSDTLDPVCEFLSAVPQGLLKTAIAAISKEDLRINRALYTHLLDSALEDERLLKACNSPKTQMTLNELENELDNLEHKNMRTRGVLCKLLIGYCRIRDVGKTDEILRKLGGQKLFVSELTTLIDLSIYKNDLRGALKFYQQGLKRPGFYIEDSRIVNLASFVIQNGNIVVAKSILNRHIFNGASCRMQGPAKYLITTAVERCGVEEALTMVRDYVINFTAVTTTVLSPIMKSVLENRDADACYALFMDIVARYKVTPHYIEMIRKLLIENKTEMLDNVIDAVSKIHSKHAVQFSLASSYISEGQFEKAREILQTLPLDHMQQKIEYHCELLATKKQLRELEAHVKLLGELYEDQDTLYYLLMRGYVRVGYMAEALELWIQAQEENVVLSNRTLLYLGRALECSGFDVPFVIPSENVASTLNTDIDFSSLTPFAVALQSSTNDALEFRKQILSRGELLTVKEETSLIFALANDDQLDEAFRIFRRMMQNRAPSDPYVPPRMTRFFLTRLAQRGMIDEIASLREVLEDNLYKLYNIDQLLSSAYVFAGRSYEFFDILDRLPATSSVSVNWIEEVLKVYPEDVDRLLHNARRFVRDGGNYSISNALCTRFFADGDYSKAEVLLTEFPGMLKQNLFVIQVLNRVRRIGNDIMSERILNLLKNIASKELCAHIGVVRNQ